MAECLRAGVSITPLAHGCGTCLRLLIGNLGDRSESAAFCYPGKVKENPS